jgi:hypothetical protein
MMAGINQRLGVRGFIKDNYNTITAPASIVNPDAGYHSVVLIPPLRASQRVSWRYSVGLASRVIPSLYARGLRLISFKNPDFVRVNHPRKLLKLPHPIEFFLQFYRALLPSELVFGR